MAEGVILDDELCGDWSMVGTLVSSKTS